MQGLERLDLGNNRIQDIAPLAGLTGLTSLDLASNQIADMTPTLELTRLTLLNLSGNQITSIDMLMETERSSRLSVVCLADNPLNKGIEYDDIAALKERGIVVAGLSPAHPGPKAL